MPIKKIENYQIEALPLHKEICAYLIDKRITFHCYNGGLRMIQISTLQSMNRSDFMSKIVKLFNLVEDKRGEDYILYKSAV